MKPLSERDENTGAHPVDTLKPTNVGMKPLSERDENKLNPGDGLQLFQFCRNEATL